MAPAQRLLTRVVFQAAGYGAVGILITVMAAWASAFWMPSHIHRITKWATGLNPSNGEYIQLVDYEAPGGLRRWWATTADKLWFQNGPLDPGWWPSYREVVERGNTPDWPEFGRFGSHDVPGAGGRFGLEDARGWPMLALCCEIQGEPYANESTWRAAGGITIAPTSTTSGRVVFRALPLRPIWRGFLADTALFAAAGFLLVQGPTWILAIARNRRGRCPKCGYELHGMTAGGCPECGWNRSVAPSPSATGIQSESRGISDADRSP